MHRAIPRRFGDKLEVIYQSALPLSCPRSPSRRHFDICVIGHPRDEVVSEAVVAGTPVIASEIPGSIGLLGEDYPGYYPAGRTETLTAILSQAETDPGFLGQLTAHCAGRAPYSLHKGSARVGAGCSRVSPERMADRVWTSHCVVQLPQTPVSFG